MNRRFYTPSELAVVKKLYATTDTADIAKKLDRSVSSVYNMANKLGIKKTDEYIKECLKKCGQMFGESGKAHRYPKGHVPINKGVKRPPGWAPGRMAETQFKKGERRGVAVKLYQPIGTERISKDGYLERKVNDDLPLQKRWKGVHRIVWEEHNGPIPDKANIIFKDGNKQNVEIMNLECVTDAQLLDKNRWQNYPPEVKQQIRILAGFRRKLNRYAKEQNRRSA